MNPYLLMATLYLSVAVLMAFYSALTGVEAVPWFAGVRWLRVHLVVLGALTEAVFGLLPMLVSGRRERAVDWPSWLALNAGLLTLLVGIPLVNRPLIATGGGLVLLAAALMARTLWRDGRDAPGAGRPFHLAALGFLLVGGTVGTGLWLGWGPLLRIAVPREAHIHANNFGFLSLVFAGLLVDGYPRLTGRPLAAPGRVRAMLWLLVLGALALVAGPWLDLLAVTGLGLALYAAGTGLLVAAALGPLLRGAVRWSAGWRHVALGYGWLLAPLVLSPTIMLGLAELPISVVEATAPQAMIYGWGLQLGFAWLPYLFDRALRKDAPPALGGSALSLLTVNIGTAVMLASIFAGQRQALLQSVAYALWAIAALPIALRLWRTVRATT